MSNDPENQQNEESEKKHRAPLEAARDAESTASGRHAPKDVPLPSRLFGIFAGLDEATPEERKFLAEHPEYQEIGERIADSLKELQRMAADRKRNRPGQSL